MQQPIKLSVGYAYTMSDEALICTVEDGQPSHALMLTVDDLRALLAAFGEADAEPQPAPVVPESVRDMLDDALHEIAVVLDRAEASREKWYTDHGDLHRSRWQAAKNWLDSLPKPQPDPLPPWALTPEQWARIPEEYICAAVDADGRRYCHKGRPRAMNMAWFNFEAEYIDTINLNGVDWQDTLTWRPGCEPEDTDT